MNFPPKRCEWLSGWHFFFWLVAQAFSQFFSFLGKRKVLKVPPQWFCNPKNHGVLLLWRDQGWHMKLSTWTGGFGEPWTFWNPNRKNHWNLPGKPRTCQNPSIFFTKDRLVEPVCRNLIGCFMYIWWYYVTMIFSSVRCIVTNLQPVYLVTNSRVHQQSLLHIPWPQFPKRQLRVRAVAFQESYKSFWWSSRTRQCGWCVSFSGYSASV